MSYLIVSPARCSLCQRKGGTPRAMCTSHSRRFLSWARGEASARFAWAYGNQAAKDSALERWISEQLLGPEGPPGDAQEETPVG